MKDDERIIKSYVWHDGKCFFVSTIDRDSSALQGGRYAETIVWEFDWPTQKRGAILHQDGHIRGSITQHMLICQCLHDQGKPEIEEREE